MDQNRLDWIARHAADVISRRGTLSLALGGLLGPNILGAVDARKGKGKRKRQNKAKKPSRNAFGCVDVGKACSGNDDLCCSGICQGKKPKKGKKDNSRCVAHNAGGCSAERSACVVDDPSEAFCNRPSTTAQCVTTTGKALFCAEIGGVGIEEACFDCRTDRDCLELGFPPGVACVLFQGGEECDALCQETGGRACLTPAF